MADDESERIEAAYALFNMAHNSRRPSVTTDDSAPTSPVTTALPPASVTPSPPATASPTPPTATIVQNSRDSDRMSFSLRGDVSAQPTRAEIAASFKYNRTPVLPKIPRHAIMTRIQSLATSRAQARNASPLNSIGEVVVTSPSDEAPVMRNLALTSMMTRSDSVPSLTRAGLPQRRLTRQLSEHSVTSPPPRLATTTNLSSALTTSSPSTLYSPITPEGMTASPLVRPQKSRDQNEPLDLSRDKNLRDAALTPLNLATHPLTSSASQAPRTPGTPMHQLAVLDGKIVLIPRSHSDVTTPSTDSNLMTSGSAVMSKARDMIANPSAYGFKLAYDSNHTLTLVPDRKDGASTSAPALPLSNGHDSAASTESRAELKSRRLSEEELRSALSPPKDARAQSSLPPKKRRILESEETAEVERKRARDDRGETRASLVASEAVHNVMQRLQSQVAQEVLELQQSGQQRVQSLPAKLQPPSPLRTASTGSDDVQDMYKQKLFDEFTRCTDAQAKTPAFMHFPPQRVRGTDATTKVSISLKAGDNWRSTVAAKFSQRTPEAKARSESPPPLVSTKQAKRAGPSGVETVKTKREIPNKNGLQHHSPSTPNTPSISNGSSAAGSEAVEEVSEEMRRKCAKAGEPDEDGDL